MVSNMCSSLYNYLANGIYMQHITHAYIAFIAILRVLNTFTSRWSDTKLGESEEIKDGKCYSEHTKP